MAEVFEQYGPYKRVRRLGMGGMAETFLAVQRGAAGFEQRVCMKFILPGHRDNQDFKRLFLREASIAASLRHSNIVGVIDVDAAAGYMVLELVDGVDLRTLLNAAPGRRLSPDIAVLITIELCKALAYAHGRVRRGQPDGIVHRDVSPSNVLISYSGEVKLTDFGVARAMRADIEPLSTTVKGKLCYMSPEQARGLQLDGRSDLFSVGVLCYELLSGRRPYDGNTDAETLLRVTAGQLTPLLDVAPHLSPSLVHVVERLVHREPEQRFASADACIDAFARFSPGATTFRELGRMARAARPHETLHGMDLEALDTMPAAEPQLPQGTLLQTQALPGNTMPPRLPTRPTPRPTPPQIEHVPPLARELTRSETGMTSMERVHRNAWIALGVSFALLVVVGPAWRARLSAPFERYAEKEPLTVQRGINLEGLQLAEKQKAEIPQLPGGPPILPSAPPEPVPVAPPPAGNDPPIPENTGGPSSDDTATGNLRPLKPKTHGSSKRPPPDNPSPAAEDTRPEATIDVGVVPIGQVWIDNKLYGWSPVRGVKLRPGRHVIAGGDAHPTVQRQVTLKPGESRKFALSLDPSSPGLDDATPLPGDR